MTAPILQKAASDSAPVESNVRELALRIQNMTLDDVQVMEEKVKATPFRSLTSTIIIPQWLKSMPDENVQVFLHAIHRKILNLVETSLTPAQLLFGYWYLTIVAEDSAETLIQSISHLACKLVTEDLSTESFTPEQPSTDWIDALQERLRRATTLHQSVEAFSDTIPALKNDALPASFCPLQFWHNFCYLLKRAFPNIEHLENKAFKALLSNPEPTHFVRISLGFRYLFYPPTVFPISYESWLNIAQPRTFAIDGIIDFIQSDHNNCTEKTLNLSLFAIESLLGDTATSETFVDKIQGAYLRLFIRFAEGTNMPIALVAPLIKRLSMQNEFNFAERIAAIEEAILHVTANRCEVQAGIQICHNILAFLKEIQQADRYDWHGYAIRAVLEQMAKIKWNIQGVFSGEIRPLEDYSLSARPFVQIRELLTSFNTAAIEFRHDVWPAQCKRSVTILYIQLLRDALKKIKQLRKPGIHMDRWHKLINKKNELVVELVKSLYSVSPPFSQKMVTSTITPLTQVTISRFENELIFRKKGGLVFIGRRDKVEVLDSSQKQDSSQKYDREEKPTYKPRFYIAPHGSIVRRKFFKKLPSSPLAKNHEEPAVK